MANQKKKTSKKNTTKKNNTKKVVKEEVNKIEKERKETLEVKKVEPKKETVEAKKEKTKKSFQLTAKEKDIVLILLVVVLLIVGLIVSTVKKDTSADIELPAEITGQVGFNEIKYSEYEEKMANNDLFMVIIVRDGCGYCEMYEPIVKKVAEEYKVPISYINLTNLTDEERSALSTSNSYLKNKKWGTPTTLFMYGSKVIDSIGGYVEEDTFVEFLKKNIKVD